MTLRERLGPDDLRDAVRGYADLLQGHREAINRLNVYPVPDGDTGTNMSLTLASVVEALGGAPDDMAATCRAISQGSLMGARGNSGVILSQILRGLAAELGPLDAVDGPALARALEAAATAAYQAVMRPVEGTILTVVREAAEAAAHAAGSGTDADRTLVAVLDAAAARAAAALDATPDLLPVLKDAGVVDAGGAGFVLLLDALLHVADGRPLPAPPDDLGVLTPSPVATPGPAGVGGHEGGTDVGDLRYEVMYLLEAPDEAIPAFKQVWAGVGDSIVVVGGEGLWNCHIHTDDIGAAIEAALDCGRPRRIRVSDLLEQVIEERWVREAIPEEVPAEAVPTAVVAVAAGDGIRRILRSLGVQSVVSGGQTMNPSTADLLAAVEATEADEVVLLPNNRNIVPVAEQVGELASKPVRVVPTRSVAEGFAALMSYDPQAGVDRNAAAMAESAAAVTTAEVTRAVRDGAWDGGPILSGDWVAMAGGDIRAVGPTLVVATTAVLGRILDGDHEVVTLIEGEGATTADTSQVRAWLEEHHGEVGVEVHHGGQPVWAYLLSVE